MGWNFFHHEGGDGFGEKMVFIAYVFCGPRGRDIRVDWAREVHLRVKFDTAEVTKAAAKHLCGLGVLRGSVNI